MEPCRFKSRSAASPGPTPPTRASIRTATPVGQRGLAKPKKEKRHSPKGQSHAPTCTADKPEPGGRKEKARATATRTGPVSQTPNRSVRAKTCALRLGTTAGGIENGRRKKGRRSENGSVSSVLGATRHRRARGGGKGNAAARRSFSSTPVVKGAAAAARAGSRSGSGRGAPGDEGGASGGRQGEWVALPSCPRPDGRHGGVA